VECSIYPIATRCVILCYKNYCEQPIATTYELRKKSIFKTVGGIHTTSSLYPSCLETYYKHAKQNILLHSSILLKSLKFMTGKKCKQSAITFHFTLRLKSYNHNIVYYRHYIASIAGIEKRLLSYQTLSSVDRAQNCGL